eukprot:COSAG05_NODE_5515_length_1155_cov_0.910038_1_plen_143_part_00
MSTCSTDKARTSFATAICDSYSSPWLPETSKAPRPGTAPWTTTIGTSLLLQAPLSSEAAHFKWPNCLLPGLPSSWIVLMTPLVCSRSQALRSAEEAVAGGAATGVTQSWLVIAPNRSLLPDIPRQGLAKRALMAGYSKQPSY